MATKLKMPSTRFWSKVDKSDECWLWKGPLMGEGYGHFTLGTHTIPAHRFAYEETNGPVPEGMNVCHDCDKNYPVGDITYRRCVRPSHLFVGTQADNLRDMVKKGRGLMGNERVHGFKS